MESMSVNRRSVLTCFFAIGKIAFFLGILPMLVTFLHFQTLSSMYGSFVYQHDVNTTPKYESSEISGLYYRSQGEKVYRRIYGRLTVPDTVEMAYAMAKRRSIPTNNNGPVLIPKIDDKGEEALCLQVESQDTGVCSNSITFFGHRISLWTTQTPNRQSFWNDVTIGIPATSLLIGLNVALAGIYWNSRMSPASVAKIYTSMVLAPYEIWRSFSGSMAHFEIWHLGFNMMTLLAVGRELEGRGLYPSVIFFLYNVSLIPIVTMIWLGLQRIAHIIDTTSLNHSQQSRPTVGYSGVLFAWIVIASLEQAQTCPVIFLPDLCFTTYNWHNLKFSLAPLVQLMVMQVILPRVSLTGHLAGILAGFAVHWGLLPLHFVQPSILIPLLYGLYLRYIRRSIAFSSLKHLNFYTVFRPALLVMASACLLGPFSSFTVSLAISSVFWLFFRTSQEDVQDRRDLASSTTPSPPLVLARAYILTGVLVLINDFMALGCWIVLNQCTFLLAILMIARTINTLTSIYLAHFASGEDTGIFKLTMGYTIMQPMRSIANHCWMLDPSARGKDRYHHPTSESDIEAFTVSENISSSSFPGSGVRLGGAMNQSNDCVEDVASTMEESRLI